MLSNKVKYALKAMLHLAREHGKGPVLIADLAEKEGIPKKFLELILLELRNHGLLQSKKGKGGGYSLSMNPDLITMGQIIRLIEGPLAPLPCVSQTRYERCSDCVDEAACGLRMIMKEVRDATARILDGANLKDLLERVERTHAAPEVAMFHI
ncbi:MAG: Rrf2 family transcriptional regulator [Planctomycetota bacterium]|nr:Rrf2 family transcriptional regulator [Planctomycetota bacterium]